MLVGLIVLGLFGVVLAVLTCCRFACLVVLLCCFVVMLFCRVVVSLFVFCVALLCYCYVV